MGGYNMTKIRTPRGLLAGLAWLAPAWALAWPAPYYGYDPTPQGQGGALPNFPVPPTLANPNGPGLPRTRGPLRFNQTQTDEGYILDIPLDGMKAEEIQVEIVANSLRLSRDISAQETREETIGDGQGYLRSYSFSSGRSSQRLPLPPDADGGAMRREDNAERVRIIIPRRHP